MVLPFPRLVLAVVSEFPDQVLAAMADDQAGVAVITPLYPLPHQLLAHLYGEPRPLDLNTQDLT